MAVPSAGVAGEASGHGWRDRSAAHVDPAASLAVPWIQRYSHYTEILMSHSQEENTFVGELYADRFKVKNLLVLAREGRLRIPHFQHPFRRIALPTPSGASIVTGECNDVIGSRHAKCIHLNTTR